MRKDKGHLELEAGDFTVIKVHQAGRWYEVTTPDGEVGAVLKQYPNAWHFFSKDVASTASNGNAATCHRGGLGDAIDDDRALKRYRELLDEPNVPQTLRGFEGVYVAMQQAVAS